MSTDVAARRERRGRPSRPGGSRRRLGLVRSASHGHLGRRDTHSDGLSAGGRPAALLPVRRGARPMRSSRRARSSGRRKPTREASSAIRFTDLDAESVDALQRMMRRQPGAVRLRRGSHAPPHRGARVSMRRPSRTPTRASPVVSDLGFLQVGKQLELEDAATGPKRPASINRVEVAVDPPVAHPPARRHSPLRRRAGRRGRRPGRPPPRSDAPSRWRRAPPTIRSPWTRSPCG